MIRPNVDMLYGKLDMLVEEFRQYRKETTKRLDEMSTMLGRYSSYLHSHESGEVVPMINNKRVLNKRGVKQTLWTAIGFMVAGILFAIMERFGIGL